MGDSEVVAGGSIPQLYGTFNQSCIRDASWTRSLHVSGRDVGHTKKYMLNTLTMFLYWRGLDTVTQLHHHSHADYLGYLGFIFVPLQEANTSEWVLLYERKEHESPDAGQPGTLSLIESACQRLAAYLILINGTLFCALCGLGKVIHIVVFSLRQVGRSTSSLSTVSIRRLCRCIRPSRAHVRGNYSSFLPSDGDLREEQRDYSCLCFSQLEPCLATPLTCAWGTRGWKQTEGFPRESGSLCRPTRALVLISGNELWLEKLSSGRQAGRVRRSSRSSHSCSAF